MTTGMNFEKVEKTCRSFRRMIHAVEELLAAIDARRQTVTPLPKTD